MLSMLSMLLDCFLFALAGLFASDKMLYSISLLPVCAPAQESHPDSSVASLQLSHAALPRVQLVSCITDYHCSLS